MRYLLLSGTCMILLLGSCETDIDVDLQDAPPIVVIDAFLTRTPGAQEIHVFHSQAYFDQTPYSGIPGTTVRVAARSGAVYNFTEMGDGLFQWTPPNPQDSFGVIGERYFLEVVTGGDRFYSTSVMGRVPQIDSLTFYFREASGDRPDAYFGELWARDLPGPGDTYWIKSFKNGVYLNKPSDINVAYDAGFSPGGEVDGVNFIEPIRNEVNAYVRDDYDILLPPYEAADTLPIVDGQVTLAGDRKGTVQNDRIIVDGRDDILLDGNPYFRADENTIMRQGDSLYVEIHSINYDTWFFFVSVAEQTNRPGGFGELFATPLANVPTNIFSENEAVKAGGMFNVAAVSAHGVRVSEASIRIRPQDREED